MIAARLHRTTDTPLLVSSSPRSSSRIFAASTASSPTRRSGSPRSSPRPAAPWSTSSVSAPSWPRRSSASPATSPASRPATVSPRSTAPPRSRCPPADARSGGSHCGNRTVNHAIHMAAVTQVRHRHSPGRGYYDRKIAEGKTPKEALRALKRRISDALWAAMAADARRAAAAPQTAGPGGQPGNVSRASAAGSHPATPALRLSHSRTRTKATTTNSRRRRAAARPTTRTARRTA